MIKFSQNDEKLIFHVVNSITGSNLDSKHKIILNNVAKRIEELRLKSFRDYLIVIDKNSKELDNFISLITIHTTSWFREFEHFKFLRNQVESQLKASRDNAPLHISVLFAGCSTGQETYSVGLLLEGLKEKYPNLSYHLMGWDIDPKSIAEARQGHYPVQQLSQVHEEFKKHIKVRNKFFTPSPTIKERCRFEVQNLSSLPAANKPEFDFIFCRNVLIYFNDSMVNRIVLGLQEILKKNGALLLGHSESLDMSKYKLRRLASSVYGHQVGGESNDVKLPEPTEPAVKSLQKPTIIYIDDEEEILEIVRHFFHQHNLDIKTFNDPLAALAWIKINPVELVFTDLNMPDMDGIKLCEKIRMSLPDVPVAIISGFIDQKVKQEAEKLKIHELIYKPLNLAELLRIANHVKSRKRHNNADRKKTFPPADVILIGASTGGPEALVQVLKNMPADLPPILIVQHIKPGFEDHLRRRLEGESKLKSGALSPDVPLERGVFYLASGNQHLLLVQQSGKLFLAESSAPPLSGHRPSVDCLFFSGTKCKNINVLGVILTGMGKDGSQGLRALMESGAQTIAQDEKSSVIFGMPGEAIRLNAATMIGNPHQIRLQILENRPQMVRKSA